MSIWGWMPSGGSGRQFSLLPWLHVLACSPFLDLLEPLAPIITFPTSAFEPWTPYRDHCDDWVYLCNTGQYLPLRTLNLILPAKSPLPYPVTHLQVLGIRVWMSLAQGIILCYAMHPGNFRCTLWSLNFTDKKNQRLHGHHVRNVILVSYCHLIFKNHQSYIGW